MLVGMRLKGKFIGVQPGTTVVYSNRDALGGWETIELTALNDGLFSGRFVDADKQLSIQPDGSLQTRPAGTVGAWEKFYATDQPDGASLVYRKEGLLIVGLMTVELK